MHKAEMGNYFLGLIKLFLIGILFYSVLAFIGPAFVQSLGMVGLYLLLAAGALIAIFMFRFALVLPAAALGKPIGVSESSALTTGAFGTLFVLGVCLFGLQLVAELILFLVADAVLIAMVLDIAFSVVLAVLNISALTTLYGYYVEKRPI